MLKPLDPLLHSELRLAVMSLLVGVEEAGNLSVQIDKLSTAGYIEVEKKFVGKRPQTLCRVTPAGAKAMEDYVETLKTYLKLEK